MKQISSKKYNKEYFLLRGDINYSKISNFDSITHIHKEIAEFVTLSSTDRVVDYGCGVGNLTFYLSKKYSCNIVGIDYSKDAIDICLKKYKNLIRYRKNINKIKFYNCNNNKLPQLSNISYVFFSDVLEHMYDEEIKMVLNKIKSWNNNKSLKVVVHTDNNLYLKYIKPIIDILSLLMNFTDINKIKTRNRWENERHVNLTNPHELRIKMRVYGFKEIKVKYSNVDRQKILMQVGKLRNIPFLVNTIFYLIKYLIFLSPSFYAVYKADY